jgi:excisionase family DNA binding protein
MTTVLLWTADEAAQQLGGVSAWTVRRMLASGELPRVKVRGAVRIPAQAVLNWVAHQIDVADNRCRVGSGVRKKEVKACHINANGAATGGSRTSTRAAKELDALLEPRTARKRRP